MSSIRSEFYGNIINQQLQNILYGRANLYYFLGRLVPWADETDPPPNTELSYGEDIDARDNMLYVRKVTPNDVSFVIPNYTWTSGEIYTQWDHTLDMTEEPFYVVTNDFNVYKCLNNNSGAISTVKPTGVSLFPFFTGDGYMWKYMYNIPLTKRRKFYSIRYIPVQKALSDSFYSKGSIEDVIIQNGGSGYSSAPVTTVSVSAPSGSGTTAVLSTTITNGSIATVSIVNAGTNYLFAPTISIPAPVLGTTAVITVTVSAGLVNGYTIVNAGSGYSAPPTPVVEAPRVSATISAYINPTTGEIDSVAITNAGAGYASPPTVIVIDGGSGAAGQGKYGNPTALLTPYMYNGRIDRVAITDPGINYDADSSTTVISSTGDGTGAVFYPKVEGGAITGVIIGNSGTNYSYIDIAVTGGGVGAELRGVIGSSNFTSDQSQVEQSTIAGAIYAIKVTAGGVGGTGYGPNTQVVITGDGVGALATPVIVNGVITAVNMDIDSYGSNYSYANISFVDPDGRYGQTSDAEAYAILPPIGGHGFNATKELFGRVLAISVLIKDDESLNDINQQYRQYGLIQNPQDIISRQLITSNTSYASFDIALSSVSGILPDDILINNSSRYYVVNVVDNVVKLQQLSSIYNIPSGSFIKEGIPGVQYSIVNLINIPGFDKYSGELMYVTNTTALVPGASQSFSIRTYLTL